RHWPALRVIDIPEQKKAGEYFVADSGAALVSLAQMDVVEIHGWNATAEALDRPNRLVFDLDASDETSWPKLAAAAMRVREALERLGLRSWLKTTGGMGLHVVMPLAPIFDWEVCLRFSRALATNLAVAQPELFTTSVPKDARQGRI